MRAATRLQNLLIPALFIAAFLIIYITSIEVTLNRGDNQFVNRAWSWSQYGIGLWAFLVFLWKINKVKQHYIWVGLLYAAINLLASYQVWGILPLGIWSQTTIIFLCFVATCLLTQNRRRVRSSLVAFSLQKLIRSALIGVALSLPFAIINILLWQMSRLSSVMSWQSPLHAANRSLIAGISEEIIFRFFILSFFLQSLRKTLPRRWLVMIAFFFGIVPLRNRRTTLTELISGLD
ncbi:hypothetical protein XM38_011120 [Halomicronema hongdechloris C2206]|uniref:Uncharacterized protein n=1 Tax=Halomicronema hongdechloris C2206 TaxID=1641165 RepID=A0A1Z3HIN3_9CYAN|nr:hypothetical protein [Halomicronema hongdechloris]ASC70182.1 hypothetical protein XM38_011120 [Halomicronema hongdechloris C2206]